MAYVKTLQQLFHRYRRPGDLVFATFFLLLSVILLSQIGEQVAWPKGGKLVAKPGFWPALSLGGMSFFALLHFIGAVVSPRLDGRWAEVAFWLRALEYSGWFMVYVWIVPRLGYLPTTMLFLPLLTLRAGYRKPSHFLGAAVVGVGIVVAFKSLLSVRIPGGAVYEHLPDGIRSFMLLYF